MLLQGGEEALRGREKRTGNENDNRSKYKQENKTERERGSRSGETKE